MTVVATLAALLVAHALCDFPLQGDFLSRAKNPARPIEGVPWAWAMAAHCAIHAGAVWYVTGWASLAACEFAAHACADVMKCRGRLTFSQDQIVHVACKCVWASLGGGV